jgi:hypothetical protein
MVGYTVQYTELEFSKLASIYILKDKTTRINPLIKP